MSRDESHNEKNFEIGMSRDESHNEKNFQRCQAPDIIELPNSTMIACVIELAFYYFPLRVNKKLGILGCYQEIIENICLYWSIE